MKWYDESSVDKYGDPYFDLSDIIFFVWKEGVMCSELLWSSDWTEYL